MRAQYALDATVTTGQKLYLITLPIAVGATVNKATHRRALGLGAGGGVRDQQPTAAKRPRPALAACALSMKMARDISETSGDLRGSNVLEFNNKDRPGEADTVVGFNSFNASNRMLVTLKAYYGQAEGDQLCSLWRGGRDTSSSLSYFGGTLGGQNGVLQISESATQNVSVTRATWAASAPYPSGPRVKTAFTFGGATVRRNTAWLSAERTVALGAVSVAGALDSDDAQLRDARRTKPNSHGFAARLSAPNRRSGGAQHRARRAEIGALPAQLVARFDQRKTAPWCLASAATVTSCIPTFRRPSRRVAATGWASGKAVTRHRCRPVCRPPTKPTKCRFGAAGTKSACRSIARSRLHPFKVRYGGFAPVALSVAQSRGWVAPGLWRWRPEGGYVRADVGDGSLKPFEGYFIFAGPERGVALVFDPNAASARSARAPSGGWSVSLHAIRRKDRRHRRAFRRFERP